jgi:UDP-glucose 4-epimerase
MNILVTGGAGFIGSHTVVALIEAGFTPVIIDDFSNSEPGVLEGLKKITGKAIKCYTQDCNNRETLRTLFETENIEGVIHFAACKAVGESMAFPLKYYRNNLGSLIVLLEVMAEMKVPNLIFSSSCTIYGQPDHLPVSETAPFKPAESVYGNTKQVGEEILHDVHAAGVPIRMISLRYFNPIGAHPSALIGELPRGVPSNLVPFVTQTAAGLRESITVFGDDYPTSDGTCVRDYIHVMDLAEAHVAAMKRLTELSQPAFLDVFNLGTGSGNTVLEVLKTFERVNYLKLNYQIGPRRAGDVVSVYADTGKAERILGWKTKRSLEDALRDAWKWQAKPGA